MPKAKPKTNSRPARKRAPARRTPSTPSPQLLYVLSDSTGNLAQHMVAVFLTQFPRDSFATRLITFLDTAPKLNLALDQIAQTPGIVFHALVRKAFKQIVESRCAAMRVPSRDLTGGTVEFLARESGIPALEDQHRIHHTNEDYHRRIDAIEFTLAHDDGLGLETLHEAQVVLAGVSRTGKSPTSIYLAQQGYKTANVSLASGVTPPDALLRLPPRRVVGLVIDPHELTRIRGTRQAQWGMPDGTYNDADRVAQEVKWSRRLFASRGWPILDVTHQAVEETAARVVALLGLSR